MATLIENRRAGYDYEILEKFQAGLELSGSEVKSLRLKRGSLEGARVIIRGNEAYIVNMEIPPYQAGNLKEGYDDRRTRRLLLSKTEIDKLVGLSSSKELTIIPTLVYNVGRYLKIGIAVVRGKKKYDKREVIKKREAEREMCRPLTG
jgi:SsrA-binding protein